MALKMADPSHKSWVIANKEVSAICLDFAKTQ